MPRRLARKLMLSITVIVIIVAAVSGLVNVKTEEQQLLHTMILGAEQLSKGITSATWHAMLDDHREAAYEVMQTIALKQGIDATLAKRLAREIKDSKLKVQASIQGEELRVSAKKRDDLQAAIALIRGLKVEQPLQYVNFRD